MADKINLDRDEYDDLEYEPSDSEEEYTERERKLLKSVRQRGRKKDVEQEVLGFDESEDDDDEEDGDKYENIEEDENLLDNSDIEDNRNDDDIPDSRAWGKKRSMYYHTDFVDQDYSTYNEKDEELALQEEEEARAIQQRLAKQLDEVDFSLDVYTNIPDSVEDDDHLSKQEKVANETEAKTAIKLKTDIGSFTERQKQQLFKKDSPEFFGLTQDFEKYLQESQKVLQPFLDYISEYDLQSPTIQFAETMNNTIFTYCTNIAFYLMLKTKRIPVKNHPVIKRLVKIRQILQQLEQKYNDVIKMELVKFIEMVESGVKITFAKPQDISEKKKEKRVRNKVVTFEDDNKFDEEKRVIESSADEKDEKEEEPEEEEEEETFEGDERRAITYQMAKNKGLTPHRKKELKNPRVKHRNKYRKALIRRKGAVRTVRKELKRYDGEISGIKATVKKGIKIKN